MGLAGAALSGAGAAAITARAQVRSARQSALGQIEAARQSALGNIESVRLKTEGDLTAIDKRHEHKLEEQQQRAQAANSAKQAATLEGLLGAAGELVNALQNPDPGGYYVGKAKTSVNDACAQAGGIALADIASALRNASESDDLEGARAVQERLSTFRL